MLRRRSGSGTQDDRTHLHGVMVATCAALFWIIYGPAIAEEPKKDAAEAVGEGNTARWLDYYRRERGQQWESRPETQTSGKPVEVHTPRDSPRSEPPAQSDRR